MRESSKKDLPAQHHPLFSVTFGRGPQAPTGSCLDTIEFFQPWAGYVQNVFGMLESVPCAYNAECHRLGWTLLDLLCHEIEGIVDPNTGSKPYCTLKTQQDAATFSNTYRVRSPPILAHFTNSDRTILFENGLFSF